MDQRANLARRIGMAVQPFDREIKRLFGVSTAKVMLIGDDNALLIEHVLFDGPGVTPVAAPAEDPTEQPFEAPAESLPDAQPVKRAHHKSDQNREG